MKANERGFRFGQSGPQIEESTDESQKSTTESKINEGKAGG